MQEIRKAIVSCLEAVHPEVYHLLAPEDAPFPYLVYTLEITDVGDDLKLVALDVDGWDKLDDSTRLEGLMKAVTNALNKNLVINSNLVLSIYLDRQLALTDDDPSLKRRTNIFMGRLYER